MPWSSVPATRIESACASGGAALRAAFFEVASGASDLVLQSTSQGDWWFLTLTAGGGQSVTVPAPLYKIPFFVREGSDIHFGTLLEKVWVESLKIARDPPNLAELRAQFVPQTLTAEIGHLSRLSRARNTSMRSPRSSIRWSMAASSRVRAAWGIRGTPSS